MQSVAVSEEADPDRGGIGEVLAAWHNAIGDEPVTLKALAARAQARDADGWNYLNPDLREALMNIAPKRDGSLDTRKLGDWLRRNSGKIVCSMKVGQSGRDGHSQKALWKVTKTKGLG